MNNTAKNMGIITEEEETHYTNFVNHDKKDVDLVGRVIEYKPTINQGETLLKNLLQSATTYINQATVIIKEKGLNNTAKDYLGRAKEATTEGRYQTNNGIEVDKKTKSDYLLKYMTLDNKIFLMRLPREEGINYHALDAPITKYS